MYKENTQGSGKWTEPQILDLCLISGVQYNFGTLLSIIYLVREENNQYIFVVKDRIKCYNLK
jgi:hypothetical protein